MIGTTVSHYRIVRHLGAGGMGTVYQAEDTNLRRNVALKFLAPGTSLDAAAAARLLREARAASALDHPHIATVYEIGEADGQPFIAMAYYEGETLAARLTRGPLTAIETARIVAEIAGALAAAHAAGIVHRDLKPSNLMLTAGGEIKVLDFGIAKFESLETTTQLTQAGQTVGTAAYMSPEQVAGVEVDGRSDVWSLGVLAYEMLSGQRPFGGQSALAIVHAVATAAPQPLRTLRPDTPPELEQIVERALVKDREQRTIAPQEIRGLAAACLARLSAPMTAVVPARRGPRLFGVIAAALVIVAFAVTAAIWMRRAAHVRWAREQALPEVIRLAGEDDFAAAYALAQSARRYIPGDPLLEEQIRLASRTADIETEPAGAAISYRPYGREDVPWAPLGRAPLEDVVIPRGVLRLRAELAGYEAAEDIAALFFGPARIRIALERAGAAPPGMVRVASGGMPFRIFIPGLDHLPPVDLPDYWIDRHEVSNAEFKRFVDAGGYRDAQWWREPFLDGAVRLSWEEAMTRFRDATGRPGPATWELGTFPAGQGDLPVGGVSWYEAAAYAQWAGKSLPTIFHWSRVADQRTAGAVVPASNFAGKGLLPVMRAGGLNRAGVSALAGNVKEWCWNAAGGKRYILGGAWNEPVYMFTDADAQLTFARRPSFGFRCMKTVGPEGPPAATLAPVEFPSRDLRAVKPVGDAVFDAYRSLYSFDHAPLNAVVESVDDSSPDWRREKVSYAAAYGDERVIAHLFLPKNASPPYQTMLVFPGSGAISLRSSDRQLDIERYSWVMRSGRALLYPVYKSTFERHDAIASDYPNMSAAWRDHMIMWSKDVGRSVDYLHSRREIDHDRIGYLGFSWGAAMGPVFLAVEPRLSLALLIVGGFNLQAALPEADVPNFAPRVKVPTLMLNGRYDFFFPTEQAQEPMLNLLGTPPDRKRYVLFDTAHNIPRNELVRESVDWMEKYWGAVNHRQPAEPPAR